MLCYNFLKNYNAEGSEMWEIGLSAMYFSLSLLLNYIS